MHTFLGSMVLLLASPARLKLQKLQHVANRWSYLFSTACYVACRATLKLTRGNRICKRVCMYTKMCIYKGLWLQCKTMKEFRKHISL